MKVTTTNVALHSVLIQKSEINFNDYDVFPQTVVYATIFKWNKKKLKFTGYQHENKVKKLLKPLIAT